MQKIDAHQHFWKFDPVRDSWISDEMSVIRKDFLPEDLFPILKQTGFDGCVAVQADQSIDETKFLLQCADKYEFIKGVVGWVDLQSEEVEEWLEYFKPFKKLKGFRHVLQGETNRALMLTEDFKRGIKALKKYDYTYDILIYPDQLQYTKEFAGLFPEQAFVVDHIAKPNIKKGDVTEWKKNIEALAELENVSCKISGMVTEADWGNWQPKDLYPYLDIVVNAFGTDRIMFGSDWPVCLVASSYTKWVEVISQYFEQFSKAEQINFFGDNAVKFYGLDIA